MSDYTPKLSKVERDLVTQFCVRWPRSGAEWFRFARSAEAAMMIESQGKTRQRIAQKLRERLQRECGTRDA